MKPPPIFFMADRDAILRKLKKLRAKAEGAEAIGSELEAQAFAEMVQKLLTEYKVEEAEISNLEESEADPIVRVRPNYLKHKIKVRQRPIEWLERLGGVVAWGHYCRLLIVPSSSMIVFVGRKTDAEVAAEVYCKFVNVAEALADKEYVDYFFKCKREGDERRARGFRQSFLRGFCSRLDEKYYEHMDALRQYYAHDKKALVVLKDARTKVDEYVEKNVRKSTKETKPQPITNRAGWLRGRSKEVGG